MAPGEMQQAYYSQRQQAARWRGPRAKATDRDTAIPVRSSPFNSRGYLLAPPLVLQKRQARTQLCATAMATNLLSSVRSTVMQQRCTNGTYQCPDEASQARGELESKAFLPSCTDGAADGKTHFGRPSRGIGRAICSASRLRGGARDNEFFIEFIDTVTEIPVLVRNGTTYKTETYIDPSTAEVCVLFVLGSPQAGLLSLLTIRAMVSEKVEVLYEFQHVQSVEGATEKKLLWALLFAYCLLLLHFLVEAREKLQKGRWAQALALTAVCAALLVHELFWFVRTQNSGERLLQLVGSSAIGYKEAIALNQSIGLSHIPWSASSDDDKVTNDAKVLLFINALERLKEEVDEDHSMKTAAFFIYFFYLFRVLFATRVHPRIALLVETIRKALDDLFHFLLLFALVFLVFNIIAVTTFGQQLPKYSAYDRGFAELFDVRAHACIL